MDKFCFAFFLIAVGIVPTHIATMELCVKPEVERARANFEREFITTGEAEYQFDPKTGKARFVLKTKPYWKEVSREEFLKKWSESAGSPYPRIPEAKP